MPPEAAIDPVVGEDGIVRNAAGTILGSDTSASDGPSIADRPCSDAASCAPRITCPACGEVATWSLMKPSRFDRCNRSPCATRFGRYDSSAAASCTRILVASGIRLPGASLSTCDTVVVEKPDRSATSRSVVFVCAIASAQSIN